MKKIGASLLLAGFVSAAAAQTNAPATRAMSLQDCIAEALKHNFDVRVERYEPLKSQLSLDAAYAAYDPTLSLSGSHTHSDTGAKGAPLSVSDADSFSSSLGGALPSGATYSLSG